MEKEDSVGKGGFLCTASDADGLVLRHLNNPYRWIFSSGKANFHVGLQTGMKGSESQTLAIDGENCNGNVKRVSLDEYFSFYGEAGFNLFRFSQKNASYSLYDDLDHYRVDKSIATDKLLALAQKHNFQIMFGIFGTHGNWKNDLRPIRVLKRIIQKFLGTKNEAVLTPDNQKIVDKEKRFINYCVARWGVYVDFWELLNERKASDKWTIIMANYIRSVDPDRKLVSISWERPDLPAIDINTPH